MYREGIGVPGGWQNFPTGQYDRPVGTELDLGR